MRLPIRARITVLCVALLATLFASLGTFVVVRLRADLIAGIDDTLGTRAAQIELGLQGSGEGEFRDVSDTSLRGLPGGESAGQLLTSSGAVLESSGDPAAEAPMLPTRLIRQALASGRFSGSVSLGGDAELFRVLAVPKGSGGEVIVVVTSLDDVNRSVGRLATLLLLAGPAALVLAGVGGWWIAGRALAPVSRMTAEADAIGIDRLDERVAVPQAADEIHDLGSTINRMLERLEKGVRQQRRFVADASHELRTPIAVMRSELDVALGSPAVSGEAREALASVGEDAERMSDVVEDLLTLARADEGQLALTTHPIDLAAVATSVCRRMHRLAQEVGVTIEVAAERPVLVEADTRRIEQVVRNLLENGVRCAGRDGQVAVRVWSWDTEARCSVEDNGPGIPSDALPHVFERFYRVESSRAAATGGSGLGLAICTEIMSAHGGRVWAESTVGHGSVFSFALPIEDGRGPEGALTTPRSRPGHSLPSN